ncbi:MAG TPA: queuosine precursor transporter [Polyangiaceae bacterium]|nr:queuosine precursor transporter [Polyangiaceae bacterium]
MSESPDPPRAQPGAPRYYDLLLGGFVAVLLCSNLIGPGKTVGVELPLGLALSFGAGNLFFPVSYIFGDVLTEVYGYARARRAIWCGFAALLFAAIMSGLIVNMPPDPSEPWNTKLQPALEVVFGNTWRIVLASMLAFWFGDFVNSYVLAKMKVLTQGRYLWMRTIGSTLVGQAVDSLVFYPIAFLGIWTADTLIKIIVLNWTIKVTIEAVCTPVTYAVVNGLKRAEQTDVYDVGTNFTPFSLD